MTRESRERAVVFADVSESGMLYQRLGDTAARNVVAAWTDAMRAILDRHSGELVKSLGDAILCVFPSADAGVLAASEMQSVTATSTLAGEQIAIHVGVHHGPVLYENGDVFGDTVNVAAYLTAAAMRDQILTTEATEGALSPALRSSVRPLFTAVLKGTGRESAVYQVLWKSDRADMTQVNLASKRVIPGDAGSLLVACGGERVRIDQWRAAMRIGRADECELVVNDRYASRQHLTIRARGPRFYLVDHSINGTYVTLAGGAETHVLRGELLLDRPGELTLGRSRTDGADQVVTFALDRRSMYRP